MFVEKYFKKKLNFIIFFFYSHNYDKNVFILLFSVAFKSSSSLVAYHSHAAVVRVIYDYLYLSLYNMIFRHIKNI